MNCRAKLNWMERGRNWIKGWVFGGERVTESQSHKVTESQSHKVTKSQSHKVTKSQSHKVTKWGFVDNFLFFYVLPFRIFRINHKTQNENT